MRREARVVGALGPVGFPVPHLVAAEPDPGPLGSAFYLMRPVEGITFLAGLDHFDGDPPAKHRVGLAMVEALARLASLDHR
jgi:aminoglycoside phosphotransferase (APT) family kinase protein